MVRNVCVVILAAVMASASASAAQKPYRNYKACWACCAAAAKHQPLPGKEEPSPEPEKKPVPAPKPAPAPEPVVPKEVDAPDQSAACTDGSCGHSAARKRVFRWFGR